MGESFIGEIRMFAGNFAPENWAFCQGQSVSISDNPALFQLIGTTYGGDGTNTFNLPDLRSRLPVHQGSDGQGNNYAMGQAGGAETVTINTNTLASHNHAVRVNANAGTGSANTGTNAVFGASPDTTIYGTGTNLMALSAKAVNSAYTPGTQPHDNIKPYVCVNYIISLYGIYPSKS